jgi:hypothetical protein
MDEDDNNNNNNNNRAIRQPRRTGERASEAEAEKW